MTKGEKKAPNCQYQKPGVGSLSTITPAGFLNLLFCTENTNLLCFRNIEVCRHIGRWEYGVGWTFFVHFLVWSVRAYLHIDVL